MIILLARMMTRDNQLFLSIIIQKELFHNEKNMYKKIHITFTVLLIKKIITNKDVLFILISITYCAINE